MPPDDFSLEGLLQDIAFEISLLGSSGRDINIRQDTLDEISRVIQTSRDTLDKHRDGVNVGPLSGSWGGEEFGRNADLAREYQVDGLRGMSEGLQSYDEAVQVYARGQQGVDDGVVAAMNAHLRAAEGDFRRGRRADLPGSGS